MIESEHWLFTNFLSYHWHVFQTHFINILSQVAIGFDRVKLRFEFCVDIGIKVDFIASGSLPLQQFIVNLSILDFFLSSLNLFYNSFLLRQLVSSLPENFTVPLNLLNTFSRNSFGNFWEVVSSELFTSSDKVVEVIFRPVSETCF